MIKPFLVIIFFCISFLTFAQKNHTGEKTSFQIAAPFNEAYDVRSDIVMVYGVNDAGGRFEERVKGWKDKGYNVQFMTGIAWGEYKDYFLGQWDGLPHLDEGQVQRNGDTIWHGKNVPYLVPSSNFLKYIKTHVKRAIDAGVSAIYLEEPEFWSRAGYSTAFKKEWQQYYKEPWQAQHESPEATYLSSKLKYHLYLEALRDVFSYIKTYGKSVGKDIKCYVPTHSLINYSSWQIVSPEASLASIKDMDGYIAQVWTGTSREPVFYNGLKKERVFENAFLEYGSMVSMTAPTGKRMYFLTDPIEDWPRSWDDYKKNYQATFTAKLLYPTVAHYEVMPWPNRIYLGKFKVEGKEERQPISPAYATQMQVMVNALNFVNASENRVNGSKGIGVLVSNSMMFQRFPTHASYEDPQLSNFYGMALPLVKQGVPMETVHMENLEHPNTLKSTRVLIMSYSNMKPLQQNYHTALVNWVKEGGVLLYYGKDNDPFQTVREWWNTGGLNYKAPSEDLFKKLGINATIAGKFHKVGKGYVLVERTDPKEIVMNGGGDVAFLKNVQTAYEAHAQAGKLVLKNNMLLKRDRYLIAAVLDEHESKAPLQIKGPVIDLFDPLLPVLAEKKVNPGEQAFLYDLKGLKLQAPAILASASRAYDFKLNNKEASWLLKSPSKTINAMRIYLPAKPKLVSTKRNGQPVDITMNSWDENTKTLFLQFENFSEGVELLIKW